GYAVTFGLGFVMDVMAGLAGARLAILTKDLFQPLQLIGLQAEMTEGVVARLGPPCQLGFHRRAVIAVERITLDADGRDFFAAKDLVKGVFDGGGASPG